MQRLLAKIQRQRTPRFSLGVHNISKKSQDLIRRMLTVDARRRIDWKDLFTAFNVNAKTAACKPAGELSTATSNQRTTAPSHENRPPHRPSSKTSGNRQKSLPLGSKTSATHAAKFALKPVDTNKLEDRLTKDSDASTVPDHEATSPKDISKLTKVEKNLLMSLAGSRKEVVQILEILKDTIARNCSNYTPIVSMLMAKELKHKTRELDKELKGLKQNNENNLSFLQNGTFRKISEIISDEVKQVRCLIADVKTETKKFFILNRDKFRSKVQAEIVDCRIESLRRRKEKYFKIYIEYLTKETSQMHSEKKKDLLVHLLQSQSFMAGVYSPAAQFNKYSVENM
jgi:serine/threonine protein kinase